SHTSCGGRLIRLLRDDCPDPWRAQVGATREAYTSRSAPPLVRPSTGPLLRAQGPVAAYAQPGSGRHAPERIRGNAARSRILMRSSTAPTCGSGPNLPPERIWQVRLGG